jgi:predicted CXXCH cytochrome family protein
MSYKPLASIAIISAFTSLVFLSWMLFSGVSESSKATAQEPLSFTNQQGYLGTESCAGCHQQQHQDWTGSHHDQAMQHADESTVKGDFNNTTFNSEENSALFFKQTDGFYARLAGPDNQISEYKILYTFGTEPLQQYLVAFPNGRLQQLPVAWNTLTQKWFDPQPDLKAQTGEWVHWTEGGKNWNSMCADCHSTNVEKNFNRIENSYSTSVSDIDVGCESCHGPGEKHRQTVEAATFRIGTDNLHIDKMTDNNPQLAVEKCARCHARRQQLTSKFEHGSSQLLDHYLPALIKPPLYHSDGQISDEVFVYGSFVQSKMHQAGVGCIDCHQPHSGKLKAEGNQLCSSCHNSEQFDSPKHHHHSTENKSSNKKQSGNQCIDCHMPGRFYMGNDFRRDHSFRIPRPDLTVIHNTPNACNDCHTEQNANWAAAEIERWFGDKRPAHFSEILTQAASNPSASIKPLTALLNDLYQPAIARATAASNLAQAISIPSVERALKRATTDKNALLRTVATQALSGDTNKLETLLPLLRDPVRSVRIATAQALTEISEIRVPESFRGAFADANREYQTMLQVNADLPSGRYQIAVDQHRRGNLDRAIEQYQETLVIDNHFNAARLNLAQLYYFQGEVKPAAELYRTIIAQEPSASEAHYSLGLLMAEQGEFQQAVSALKNAGNTGNPRAWYNLAILYQQRDMMVESEQSYLKALTMAPGDAEFINGLVSLYGQQQRWPTALLLVDQALAKNAQNRYLAQLKSSIERRIQSDKK